MSKYSLDETKGQPLSVPKVFGQLSEKSRKPSLSVSAKSSTEKFITFYYTEEDAPHFQVFSMKLEHVRAHYHHEEVKTKIVECVTLEEFLNKTVGENTIIDILSLDIEGIDAEVVLENDWNKINCRYLSVEHLHLHEKAEPLRQVLSNANYQFNGNGIDFNGYDWSFIKHFG